MKKKVILKRIFHRNELRLAMFFIYDENLTNLARMVAGVKWSQSNVCWYAPDNEQTLKQIITLFRDQADIDISAIVSKEKETVAIVLKEEKVENKIKKDNPVNVENTSVKTSSTVTVAKKRSSEYDPVLFTIHEADGRLIIRFTGRYNQEWITELGMYGRVKYDGNRKEWLLKWSQLTVDSLADYFSGKGIELIVKKTVVPDVLKDARKEKGEEVRSRKLNTPAREGINLVRSYLEEKRYSERTIESYLAHLELFFKYYHDKDPDDISPDEISGFLESFIINLGYSSSYQNIIISAIKIYYKLRGLRRPGSDSLTRPRRSRALPKVFSKEEVMKIFEATKNNKHKLILWLIYSCGLRRGEVTKIKLIDLDTERGIIHIREGKGNVDRVVPVPQKIWEKISNYMKSYQPVEYLFEGETGGRYSVESVYSIFKQSMKRAGIKKDVGVHCLRHSYATHLHEAGLDIRYIQELLGHKSTRTTEIYTHVSRRNLLSIRSPIEDMDI